jgi:hypothetical protein
MRKIIAGLALGAALVAPGALAAQTSSGTVNATALVQAVLQVSSISDLDFGVVTPGTGVTLTPGTVPGTGSLGVLEVQHNSDVTVSATVPAALANGANTLPVTFSCGWSAAQNGALDGGAASCDAPGGRSGPANGTPVTSYLQVGGSIAAGDTNNRVPGTYTGSLVFTFTAQY